MESLTTVVVAVLGAIGAVVLHLIASDLHHQAPILASRLIKRAARCLPGHIRARYEEEWLAHLQECETAVAKLSHGMACFLCARSLRRLRQIDLVQISFNNRVVEVDVATAFHFALAAHRVLKEKNSEELKKVAGIIIWCNNHVPDLLKLEPDPQLNEAITQAGNKEIGTGEMTIGFRMPKLPALSTPNILPSHGNID